jgi:hypothetical protein
MKCILSILALLLTNLGIAQTLRINNGIDTIFFGANNEIIINTDIPNIILKSKNGELRRIEDHYYIFKMCDSNISNIVFSLVEKGRSRAIKEFYFDVVKAPDPVVFLVMQTFFPGVRAGLKNGVYIPFIVKEFNLEIIKRTGERSIFFNRGSQLESNAYLAFREFQNGDIFRIRDIIVQIKCESTFRHLAPTEFLTINKQLADH